MRLWLIVGDQILDLDSNPVQSSLVADDKVKEFEAFFEREKERPFQALCLVTRNRFEAEELAQDAFLSVYERRDRVAKMDEPTGYLYRTAMNAFRSWHRRSSISLTLGGACGTDQMVPWVSAAISGRSVGGGRWTLTELWEGGNRCA
jgi:Sigma-70 region 2